MEDNSWDIELVEDIFCSRDASIIISIPVDKEVEDSWYWRNDKFGNYTVKSAYLMLEGANTNANSPDNSGFWRKLWNLKIPPKVKNFLWRASSNCLPTKDNLIVKQVPVTNICAVCNAYTETILHTLVQCPFAASVLDKCNKPVVCGEYYTFADLLELVFQQNNTEDINNTVMICWMLWRSRNELIWNQKSLELSEVLKSAYSVLNHWRSVQDRTFDLSMGYIISEDGKEHWNKPPANSIKINTDATIFEETNSYSFAWVVRNHEGSFIEAQSKCLRGSPSPELAEVMGIREVLSWVMSKDQHNVIIESDCLQMIQAIRSSFLCLSYLGRVVQDCRTLLAKLSSKNVMFRFVKRSANKVAHFLARDSCSIADRIWKVGDVHSNLQLYLWNDLSNE